MLLRKPFQHVVAQSSATLGPVFTEVKTPSLIMGRGVRLLEERRDGVTSGHFFTLGRA